VSALLEVHGVSKRFGGLMAVRDVDFAVAAGELVGLIGPNGAGKTTLFSLLSGFLHPDAGRIRFDGVNLGGLIPERRCRLGLVRTFQLVKPFANMTVEENVMVGAFVRVGTPRAARAEAERVLALTGLAPVARERARTLPVEQRKRLEVARALATRPRLLLLDEVFAGLNPTEINGMVEFLRALHTEGMTLLVIEHVMAVIMRVSQRVIVLHHGEKIAEGPPAEVLRDEKVVAVYLGKQHELAGQDGVREERAC
jgi:branched-chain amino acid transport system ATP-binding protein